MFFVILVTHPKSYIETTDRRDFGVKPSVEVKTGAVVKNPKKFSIVGGARSKTAFFRVFRVPFDCPAHSLQETVLPKPMVAMESRDSGDVPFANLETP